MQQIQNKLNELDPQVFYGMVDKEAITTEWNYIVFRRKTLSVKDSKSGYSDRFIVAIIREDYIPEGFETQVIDKMLEIDGMRLANPDCQYDYMQKPNTNIIVELLTMEFVKARKRVVS